MWYGIVSLPGASHIKTQQAGARTSQGRNSRRLLGISGPEEAVAHAADRLDRQVAQLGPQAPHARLDDVASGIVVDAPDVAEQLVPPADVPAMAHEVPEQLELALGEDHVAVGGHGASPVQVEADAAGHQEAVTRAALGGVHEVAAHAGHHLGGVERLADE